MQEIDHDLRERIAKLKEYILSDVEDEEWEEWTNDLVKFVKEKLLGSYRAGQEVGQKIGDTKKTYDRARREVRRR
jgi:hypothetical protein